MVSIMPSAVSGFTKQEAPSAGVVPRGKTRHWLALMQRNCAYIAPPRIATVFPISAWAWSAEPVRTTTPAPSLPTGNDGSMRPIRDFITGATAGDPLRHVPRSCQRSVTRGGSRHLAGRRPVRGGTPVGHGESPPAPERTVEGNDRYELVALCAGEVELGRKELLLGLEDLEVTRDAVIVALERKRDRRLKRLYRLGAQRVQ